MFRFLLGLIIGAIGGAAYGGRFFRDSDWQTQIVDTQDRLTNLMSEVRSVLDETRGELRQAWDKTRESAQGKVDRLQSAVETSAPAGAAGGMGSGSSTSNSM